MGLLDALVLDLRYAIRSLLKAPGFSAVAVLTLALGIGANTAVFSVVNAVLLRPLPYGGGDRLVALSATLTGHENQEVPMSMPEYQDIRRGVPALADVAAAWPISINVVGAGAPERVQAVAVSPNYLSTLGVAPLLGRGFTRADAGDKLGHVALLSYGYWRRRFGGNPDVVGTTVRMDDDPTTITGVMPDGFRHPTEGAPSPVEVWGTINLDNPDTAYVNNRRWQVFELIGRLRPGATVRQAQAQLDVIRRRTLAQFPNVYPAAEGWRVAAVPLAERVVGDVRPALLVLLGAVGFVLLIACANVANLLLARGTAREREVALRAALGANRSRLVRQLLTESVLLASAGGLLGLLFAVWLTQALGHLAGQYLPGAGSIAVDYRVLGFTAGLIVLTGIGFGLLPAVQTSRPDLQRALTEVGRAATGGAARSRTRGALVVAEVAIALILLTGAGLLVRSFRQLMAVDPGFNPERLLTLQVWLSWPNEAEKGRYFSQAQRNAFYDRLLDVVRAVPGVESVALTSRLPLRGSETVPFTIEGRPTDPEQAPPRAEGRLVSPGYFETMKIPLRSGRGLSATADSTGPGEALVNSTMAQKYWPGQDPVGRRFQLHTGGVGSPWSTIVGVVGDVRQIGLDAPASEEAYLSYRRISGIDMTVVLRTAGEPGRVGPAAIEAIHSIDPEQPVFRVLSMEQVIQASTAERRFSLLLLSLFAALALLLSAVGVYGVMAYTTGQRAQEIGIRMALGARSNEVLALVVGRGMRLIAVGLGLGLLGALALSQVLVSQLYGVSASDPTTYLVVALLLGGVALLASYLPARRAARMDPMAALRVE